MDRTGLGESFDEQLRAMRLVAAAIGSSLVVYVGLAALLTYVLDLAPVTPGLSREVVLVIGGLGPVIVVVGSGIERLVRAGATGSRAPAEELLAVWTRSTITGFAVREGGAALGFVATLLSGQILWVLLASGTAAAGMAVAWPRRHTIEDWIVQNRRPDAG